MTVLRQAKTDKADCLLATTRQDNINLMVAQVAKVVFQVPKVMARIFNRLASWSIASSASKPSAPPSCRPNSF
jgi:hypothetical protein